MIKEVLVTEVLVQNHSTVTDCFSTNTFDPKNSNKKDVESISKFVYIIEVE